MQKRFTTLLILFILVPFLAQAQNTIFLNTEENYYFGRNTSIYIDSTNTLQLKDVQGKEFKVCKEKVYSPGPSQYTYWVKFTVQNNTDNQYCLVVDNPYIKDLELIIIDKNNESIIQNEVGFRFLFESREIQRNNYVFNLDLPNDKIKTFYIRYSSIRGELPLILSTAPKLYAFFEVNDFSWGIFFGIFFIIIIYNLFLFAVIRDLGYLLYIGYIFVFCLVWSMYMGYSFQYIFPDLPWLNDFLFSTNAFAGVFSVWFGLYFLKVKEFLPKLYRVGQFFIFLFLAAFFIGFFNQVLYAKIVGFSVLIVAPFMILLAVWVYIKGYTPARFYLIASTLFVLTIIINNLRILDILPHTFFTFHAVHFGIILEAVLFSIALGDRYQMYRTDKEKIQQELNRELKIKIKERARNQKELKKINKSLIQTNADLDNFIYTASHDLKSPIINIEGIINLLNSDPNEKERKELYDMILASVQKFRYTISDLTEVSKVQQMQEGEPELNEAQKTFDEVTENLKSDINNSNASIYTNFIECPTIKFSKKNLSRIIENLLINAIKFRSPQRSTEIFITTRETNEYYILSIKDNGLGINSEYKNKIFSLFKKAHSNVEGRGIGLFIVKRIIENAGGRIEVESEEGKGSTFTVYFVKKTN